MEQDIIIEVKWPGENRIQASALYARIHQLLIEVKAMYPEITYDMTSLLDNQAFRDSKG